MPKNIKRSVGVGGANSYADVATVQYLLNCTPKGAGGPATELAVDGIAGPLTQAAIKRFQMAKFGRGDGRVDPGGPAIQQLQSYDPYPNQPMPLPAYGSKGGKQVPAGKYAANQVIIHGITEAIAAAVAAASGLPVPQAPGWKLPPNQPIKSPGGGGVVGAAAAAGAAAGVAGKVTGVVQAAASAAAKAIEEMAKQGGKGGKQAPGGGLLSGIQKAAEAAKRAAEAAAKQAGLKVPQGGYDIPSRPGGPGGPFGLGELARKVAETAARAAKEVGAGGKTVDPGKMPMPMPPVTPGGSGGMFGKIIQTAAEAAAKAVKQMSHDDGGGKGKGVEGGGVKGGAGKGSGIPAGKDAEWFVGD
ncbi:MAG TPA: peptidoglycan-binding domain-containing protein [Bryobacteraceae bacterium]|nr:peptidoglycan-binding domain-containing protein [Bryobacteraceae bacterium]